MSSTSSCCIEVAASPEQLCYIPCSFCNIVLVVSVPCSSLYETVTVRCGHCTNLWSVNMGMALSQAATAAASSFRHHGQDPIPIPIPIPSSGVDLGSSSPPPFIPAQAQHRTINPPPEKRQRVPSAYNQFIKQEIQRIKANNPSISHREAFSAAAKNWAHFPHIHFGLMLDGNNHQTQPHHRQGHEHVRQRIRHMRQRMFLSESTGPRCIR